MLADLNQEKKQQGRIDKNVAKSTQKLRHLWLFKTYFLSHLWNHIYLKYNQDFQDLVQEICKKNQAGKKYKKLFFSKEMF